MSTDIYAEHGLYVTRVAAPASEGTDRRRWEVFTPHEPVRLSKMQVLELVEALSESVDPSRAVPHV
jgi:hypothetical protein